MRSITRRRLIWAIFVILILWSLAFAITQFFLPELSEVPNFESTQAIKDAVTSGVVMGTLIVLLILILGAILFGTIMDRNER